MTARQFEEWREAFLKTIQEPEIAAPLKAASLAEDLKAWTACLTSAVVTSCRECAWLAAAKGHRLDELPQAGQEYLGIDVMAFAACGAGVSPAFQGAKFSTSQTRKTAGETPAPQNTAGGRWRLPIAAFELENHRSDDRVAYSLWKLLCVRADLRVVFAFRRDWEESRQAVEAVGRDVIGSLSPAERTSLTGETVMIVGNRGEGETFPWGYFKMWLLDSNVGRFEKV